MPSPKVEKGSVKIIMMSKGGKRGYTMKENEDIIFSSVNAKNIPNIGLRKLVWGIQMNM